MFDLIIFLKFIIQPFETEIVIEAPNRAGHGKTNTRTSKCGRTKGRPVEFRAQEHTNY